MSKGATPSARFENARKVPDANPDEDPDWVDLREKGDLVTGTIVSIKENCGQNGSTVYKIDPDGPDEDMGITGDEPVLFWGKQVIDSKVRRADLDIGDWLGVRCEGLQEVNDPDANDFYQYDVRFERQ